MNDAPRPSETSLASELRTLARATRAAVRRRASLGVRRVAQPPARALAPAATEPRGELAPAGVARVDSGGEELRARAAAALDLASLRAAVAACEACELCKTRTQTVFADGTGASGVMFVGEAPGYHEDKQGVPFVGRAGQLLTDIIEKGMGLRREDVIICNVLKCRPPDNRDPSPEEKRLCTAWLDRQIELVEPKILIALGRHAAGHLLGSQASMGQMRGRVHHRAGRPVVATYHPAFLLRSPHMKRDCWKDIQLAMATVGIPRPGQE